MALPLTVAFVAGRSGEWRVERISAVSGESLPQAERVAVLEGKEMESRDGVDWVLRGVTSNTRYTQRLELNALAAVQAGLHRP